MYFSVSNLCISRYFCFPPLARPCWIHPLGKTYCASFRTFWQILHFLNIVDSSPSTLLCKFVSLLSHYVLELERSGPAIILCFSLRLIWLLELKLLKIIFKLIIYHYQSQIYMSSPSATSLSHQSSFSTWYIWYKGLFINDVITFGGYPDPPSPCHHVIFWLPPPFVRVIGEKNWSTTKQRTLGRW